MNAWAKFNHTVWACHNNDDAQGPVNIEWADRMGAYNLDDNRVVELELSTNGTMDKYEGYLVTITHKVNGEIAQHYFAFDDMMDKKDREDKRKDYPLRGNTCFYVTRMHGEVDWYIAKPNQNAIVDMQTTILGWIDHYQ